MEPFNNEFDGIRVEGVKTKGHEDNLKSKGASVKSRVKIVNQFD